MPEHIPVAAFDAHTEIGLSGGILAVFHFFNLKRPLSQFQPRWPFVGFVTRIALHLDAEE
jgi:hypothetical protein